MCLNKYLVKKAGRSPAEVKELLTSYMDKKREAGEKPDLGIIQRVMLGSAGVGMVRGNMHPIIAGLKGRENLWHGSATKNLMTPEGGGILNEGLSLQYSGINNRANNALTRNSPITLTERFAKMKGRPLTHEQEMYLHGVVGDISEQTGANKAFQASVMSDVMDKTRSGELNVGEALKTLSKQKGYEMTPAELNELEVMTYDGQVYNSNPHVEAHAKKSYIDAGTPEGAWDHLTYEQQRAYKENSVKEITKAKEEFNKFFAGDDIKKTLRREYYDAQRQTARINEATGKFESLHDKVRARVPEISERLGLDPHELGAHFDKNSHKLGRRIYFGSSPESVAYWGGIGNEAGYALANASQTAVDQAQRKGPSIGKVVKTMASSAANQATGGYYDTIRAKMKYGKPEEVLHMQNIDEVKRYLSAMHPDELAKHRALMQFSTPTGTLDSMADFPVIRRVIQSSPMLKELMGNFMPQADPSKDLSIHENVGANKLRTMDLIDDTSGKLMKRIHIKDFEKSPMRFLGGKGNRLGTLGRIAAPLGITGLGGYMAYKAIKPKQESKLHLADSIPDAPQGSIAETTKTAGVSPKVMAALFGVPAAAGITLGGGAYLADRAMKKENYVPIPKELQKKFTPGEREEYNNKAFLESSKSNIGAHTANLLAAGVGMPLVDPGGYPVASALTGMASTFALAPQIGTNTTLMATNPETMIPGIDKIPAADKFVRDHPYLTSGALAGATLGAVPAAGYYMAKKYYPYSTQKLFNGMSRGFKGDMKTKRTILKKLVDRIKDMKITAVPPAAGLATALGLAGAGYATSKVYNRARRIADEQISNHNEPSKTEKTAEEPMSRLLPPTARSIRSS